MAAVATDLVLVQGSIDPGPALHAGGGCCLVHQAGRLAQVGPPLEGQLQAGSHCEWGAGRT